MSAGLRVEWGEDATHPLRPKASRALALEVKAGSRSSDPIAMGGTALDLGAHRGKLRRSEKNDSIVGNMDTPPVSQPPPPCPT